MAFLQPRKVGGGDFHQCIYIKMEVIFAFVLRKIRKICLEISFVEEYILPLVSSGNYMIKGTREMDARFASHDGLLTQKDHSANFLLQLPDPIFILSYLRFR